MTYVFLPLTASLYRAVELTSQRLALRLNHEVDIQRGLITPAQETAELVASAFGALPGML